MDMVLAGLNLSICLAYLDDIILFSKNAEEHLQRLELLLQRLSSANLKLKPSKCSLLQTHVSFLGHIVSGEGIATDPQKTELINNWPVPKTVKELRGFLGLAGYYRKFVKDYSKVATPLNALLKKNFPFLWTEECQEAFEELKKRLQTPPILTLPNEHDVFVLDTDASEESIGSVLSQVQDGEEKVVAYSGRTLTVGERNYCIYRKELLAVVYFLKKFRQYLLGKEFVIRTDHAALTWLRKTSDPIGQNARWMEFLEEYNFKVEHRPGERHGNADAISRHPCLNRPSCTACHPTMATCAAVTTETDEATKRQEDVCLIGPLLEASVQEGRPADHIGWSTEELVTQQQDDPEIKFVRELRDKFNQRPNWKEVEAQSAAVKTLWNQFDRLEFRRGLLCRKWISLRSSAPRWQIILPEKLRRKFV